MNLFRPEHLRSLPGPENTSRQVLSNGITILVRSNENSPSVVVSGYLPAGSMFDPREKLGLAYFSAAALMRGTAKRGFSEIYNDLETAGASLGFGASVHTVNFGGRGLAEDLSLLVGTLADCLKQPAFPEVHVERLRAQFLSGLAIREQDTAEMASLAFDEILFKNHPYGLPENGYIETVREITREDLAQFHQAHYRPDGMVLVVVGAVSPQQVFDLVQAQFGDWQPAGFQPVHSFPVISTPQEVIRKHLFLPEKTQVNLVMGTYGPRRTDPNYLTASLGNNILGQFGMMGRIGESVRENAGLAYSASTGVNAWIEGGSWEVWAGVDPKNVQKAIDLIKDEIRRFINEPVTKEELADSQAYFVGRLPLNMETNAGMAHGLLNIERFHLGLDYYRHYPASVMRITRDDILDTARQYLNLAQFVIVSAGPELL